MHPISLGEEFPWVRSGKTAGVWENPEKDENILVKEAYALNRVLISNGARLRNY